MPPSAVGPASRLTRCIDPSSPRYAVIAALRRWDAAVCIDLIAKGADIHVADEDGVVPLVWAVRIREPAAVAALLRAGADPNAADDDSSSAVLIAAEAGQADICKLLLAHSKCTCVNAANEFGCTPLSVAAAAGHASICEMLLAAGADVHVVDGSGYTALHLAVEANHLNAARVLLAAGADPNTANMSTRDRTPLITAVRRRSRELCTTLLAAGADAAVRDGNGESAAVCAARQGWDDLSATMEQQQQQQS